jgi:hypothetical protein
MIPSIRNTRSPSFLSLIRVKGFRNTISKSQTVRAEILRANRMSKFEEFRERQLAEKYGIRDGKLETTKEFTFSPPPPNVSKFHREYMDGIRSKWGLSELQIEGREKPHQRTLADDVRERERMEARGEKLFAVAGGHNGRFQSFWVSVRY